MVTSGMPRRQGLLHDLEGSPYGNGEYGSSHRQIPVQKRLAHDLIDGIVPPDVLVNGDEFAGLVETARGMDPTRAVEEGLLGSEPIG